MQRRLRCAADRQSKTLFVRACVFGSLSLALTRALSVKRPLSRAILKRHLVRAYSALSNARLLTCSLSLFGGAL